MVNIKNIIPGAKIVSDILGGAADAAGVKIPGVSTTQTPPSFTEQFGNLAAGPLYTPDAAAFRLPGFNQLRGQYLSGRESAAGRQAPLAAAIQIDQAKQAETRRAQMELLAQLQGQAQGQTTGPTQAALVGQLQREAALRQSMGTQDATAGLAMAGQGGLGALQAATQQRATEQAAAMEQLYKLSGQARGQDIGLATGQAQLDQQTAIANQQAKLEQQQLNDRLVAHYTQLGFNLEQAQMKAYQEQERIKAEQVLAQLNAQAAVTQANQQAQAAKEAAGIGLLGVLGGASIIAASDKNLKTNIKEANIDLDKTMDLLKSYSYEYKDQDKYGKDNRFGVMAQDLEKSETGKKLVISTTSGKMIDLNKSVSLALAGLARINERLKKIEEK